MAEMLKQQEEFKNMLQENGKPYEDFGNGLIIVVDGPMVNVRQFHSDGFCLSSWIDSDSFKRKIGGFY
jgi:hypothetical protein